VQVVPRTWTHLLAEASGDPIDPATPTPQQWRDYVGSVTAEPPPQLMTEGVSTEFAGLDRGYDPADPVDQAILATRNAVFPLHGLFP
jgi:acetoin utilization protein AcuC